MGKKSKIGRQRKDKFYHLAKETGFRSRAAFKLIQLNRKYNFLDNARVLIDLCAAPGGWMQVAKNHMPVSSIVIGVDMYRMDSVPGCISLLEDITTDKCRISLQRELKTWKADVILHDGAPNIGKNWLHDAYNQNCLTLSALKLATVFLKEGGWFVSKVFRSKDYNCLLWVFNQLFKKVYSTKPSASRSESAEIFVVCQHYFAPAKLDSRLLNPNYVFKELDTNAPVTIHSLLKSVDRTGKPKAKGYPDDPSILSTRLRASDFMSCDNPAVLLKDACEIILDDQEILSHSSTTNEIKKCCEDIKVLGKKDLRNLISWWKTFRDNRRENKEEKIPEKKNEEKKPSNNLPAEEKELEEVVKQIQELEDVERRELKRKRRKTNKERTKLQMKMNLNMTHKDDLGPSDTGEKNIFQLSLIKSKNLLTKLIDQKPEEVIESDEKPSLKRMKKIKYNVDSSYIDDSGMYYRSTEDLSEENECDHLSVTGDDDTDFSGNEEQFDGKSIKNMKKKVTWDDQETVVGNDSENVTQLHPLITDLDYRSARDKRVSKAQLWYDKDAFKDIENAEDEECELDKMASIIKSKGGKVIGADEVNDDESDEDILKKRTDDSKENDPKMPAKPNRKTSEIQNSASNTISSLMQVNEWDIDESNLASEKKRLKKERKILDAEGLALGSIMVNSKKAKRDIIDEGWNRYAFNDENLPEWFVEDEKRYMRKEILVSKELVDEYKKSREELNVRPIKKVMEAKARKKKRTIRKLEKLKKKLEVVMENPDITDAEKAKEAKQMYKKLKQRKPEVKYIVMKKHTAAKRIRRPKGVKGPYKLVDSRMKKDLRKAKAAQTKGKSSKSNSRNKNKSLRRRTGVKN